VGASRAAGFARGGPERLVALFAPLPEHRAVYRREPALAGQGGRDDGLQPGVVEGDLVKVGIGAPATGKGDRPVLGPELAQPRRGVDQRRSSVVVAVAKLRLNFR